MDSSRKKALGIALFIILVVILAVIFWLKPSHQTAEAHQTSDDTTQPEGQIAASQLSTSQALSFASKSQQDTQINCQIRVNASNRLIVNEQTKDCFEYFITQYGEKTIEQIKTDFQRYLQTSYKEPVLSQLSDLWTRYMDYRSKLADLQAPNADKESAKYYQQIVDNIKNLRKKFFSDYEIQGLFGTQDTYDQYTVDRMAVMDDASLSASEKARKLKALFDQLPEDWKENLQQLNQLEDLRKLTADIKARGGSAQELHQMRTNLVGPEATQRLETLDVQRGDWKNKVNQYLSERDTILNSNMSDSAKQSAIQQLKSQQFSNQQEQLRLQTFETVHDQGGQLPFAN
ncbi:lipase secretion chaperone [Acinetobacter bereziniae]|uniref:lipase secretion chaperone n=1 Tax=Acinetobacter bereziniae TaxID=106648 RepID=UPI00073F3697|nr:lipase secretion chaperone [Acinetobacter bereziniae]RSZ27934.1 lipase chaperone [Acinetobacter bereziniae]